MPIAIPILIAHSKVNHYHRDPSLQKITPNLASHFPPAPRQGSRILLYPRLLQARFLFPSPHAAFKRIILPGHTHWHWRLKLKHIVDLSLVRHRDAKHSRTAQDDGNI